MMKYDLVVIGAGPAGVSAAVYACSRGMRVCVLEKNRVGGIIGNVSTVTHYAAVMDRESGASFAKRLEDQLRAAGAELRFETVQEVDLKAEPKKIVTDCESYEATAVVLANGSSPRHLGIPGEQEFAGHGIGLNAAHDGEAYRGKNMYVVGGADGAIKEAIYLAKFANKLTVIHFEPKLGCISEFKTKLQRLENVQIRLNTRLTAVMGRSCVDRLELTNEQTGAQEIIADEGCGIFVYAGLIPNTDLYNDFALVDGRISVNEKMETAIPGVYAAGDIRAKQVFQVATAVSDGAIAGINACAWITAK